MVISSLSNGAVTSGSVFAYGEFFLPRAQCLIFSFSLFPQLQDKLGYVKKKGSEVWIHF